MTERDAFEVRFGAAVRGYAGRVSSDLDPVELAHRIAGAEPRRRRFGASLGRRAIAVPRVAWVLLLLAALLAALVGGMLLAGSQGERRLPVVVPPVGPVFTPPTAYLAVSAGTYTAVSTGGGHTCAIRTDGTLDCWGANFLGQATPPDGVYVAVSAGGNHTCAIRTDGTLTCWGSNVDGQATPPPGTYSAVSAGSWHTCAIRTNGILACWGSKDAGQATIPSGTYRAVTAGQEHTCAIRTDGTLACWGFGDGRRVSPPVGPYVSVDDFDECAIRTDGTLACWATGEVSTPPPGTYAAVRGGYGLPCAIRTDGTLNCWGPEAGPPPPAGSCTALSNSLPDWEACAIRTDGKLTCWSPTDWTNTRPGDPYMGPSTALIPEMRGILPASEVPALHRGTIEFGSGGSGCRVTTPSTTFSVGDTVHFVANLEREVRADEAVTIALSVDGDVLGEPASRMFDMPGDCIGGLSYWAYAAPPWGELSTFPISWRTGHYRLELSAGGKLLASGEFNVGL